MRKKIFKKLISSFLAITLCLSSTSIGTFAKEDVTTEKENSSPISDDVATGYIDSGIKFGKVNSDISLDKYGVNKSETLPETYDSRDKNFVTNVKNQNPWGTCWAFAAVAAMESYALSHGLVDSPDNINLSEFALAYLTFEDEDMLKEGTGDYSDISDIDLGFNAGGNDEMAYKALSNGLALYNDDEVQYTKAQNDGTVPKINWDEDEISYILTGQKFISMEEMNQVKTAIIENGAVSAAYYSDIKYANQNYTYNYNYELSKTNHAIAIVGWDDAKEKELFTVNGNTPSKDGAWLIKNSWSTSKGEDGYVWISYEDKGLLTCDAVVYEIAPKTNYPTLYQHDGATVAYNFISGKEFASVYEVEGNNQVINAVSFFIKDTNREYTVKVYDNSDGSSLSNGTLVASKSGATTFGGYYTVDLDNDYVFFEGDKFSVVVTFDDYTYFLFAYDEEDLAFAGTAYSSCNRGQSYIKYNTSSPFYDAVDYSNEIKNISLKAYSKPANKTDIATKIKDAELTDNKQISINWHEVEEATSYELYRNDTLIKTTTDTSYIDSAINYGETYSYKVRPVFENNVYGAYSYVKEVKAVPSKISATVDIENKHFVINWDKTSYVDGYDIFIGKNNINIPYIDTVDSNTTTYTYNEELEPAEYYYLVVKPYVLNDSGDKVYAEFDVIQKRAFAGEINVTDISQQIEGLINIEWEVVDEGFIEGYMIYASTESDVKTFEVEKDKTSYTLDVSEYGAGERVTIDLYPCANTEYGLIQFEIGYSENLVLKEAFDEAVYWDVKNNQIHLYMPSTEAETYEVYYDYDEENKIFLNKITVTAAEMKAGFLLPIEAVESFIGIGCKETNAVVPKELFKVGEAYVEPSLEDIPNGRVLKDTGLVLKANVLNKMENFHYQYQWYVSDTKNGEGTAIDGAISDEYIVKLGEQDVKYYYCIVTCEYNNAMSFQTTNALGEKTKVVGKANADDIVIEDISTQSYTSAEVKPSLTIKDGDTVLLQGVHYTVAYENNVNVGTATAKITFIGDYSLIGTMTKDFEISATNISSWTVSKISDKMFTGNEIYADFTVTKGFELLREDIDYTVSYENNINAGVATVIITGVGNCTGTLTKTFNITPALSSYVKMDNITAVDYTGQALTPDATLKYGDIILVKDTDYTVSYSNNVNAGLGTINFTFKGNYQGTLSKKFTINPKSVAGFSVSSVSNQTYSGKYITPGVTVKDGNKTLVSGTDYVATYSNNVNVGSGKITITGKGNYTGSLNASFVIVAKSLSNVTVNNIADQTYTGSAITPLVTLKDASYKLVSGKDYTIVYSNNTNTGTAKITVTGKGNYTGTKTLTFKINAVPSKLTSGKIAISEATNLISKIAIGTTVNSITNSINEGNYIAIYNNSIKLSGNALVGTGMKLCIMNGSKVHKEYKLIVTGDTNGDGKISITDMISVKAKLLKKQNLSNEAEKAADVNGDGKINITDFIKVKAALLGKDKISGVSVQ